VRVVGRQIDSIGIDSKTTDEEGRLGPKDRINDKPACVRVWISGLQRRWEVMMGLEYIARQDKK
jgi:hypothetical protein